jgi:predicted TPR repeat methyltransferase
MAKPHPSPHSDKVAQAVQLQRQGQLDEARKIYRAVLRKQPGNADALHFLGVLMHQTGHSEPAVDMIARALAFNPRYTDAHLNLGNILREMGRLDDAAARYRQLLALVPGHALALNNLGVVLRNQGRALESLAVLQQGLAAHPDQADLHFNLGKTWRELDEIQQALDAFRCAISLNPQHADAHWGLWDLLMGADRRDEALAALRDWLAADPGNPVALHHLAASGGADEVPGRASDRYVQQTFDDFASSFDKVLTGLDYQAPALVTQALQRHLPPARRQFDLLDAGCGTGWCGPLIEPWARTLVGVDLSAGMLSRARGRKVYHRLIETELVSHLTLSQAAYDVGVSADTFNYFGELGPLFRAAHGALRGPGLLVFTLERADTGTATDYRLLPHGRYAHRQDLVEPLLRASGFELLSIETVALRKETGQTVWGLLICAAHR